MESLVNRLAVALRHEKVRSRKLQTAQDVIDLLEEQVELVRDDAAAGAVEKARTIGYLAGISRQAIETGNLAVRLERLEEIQKQRSRR